MVVIFARKLRLTYEVLTTIDLVVMYAHLVEDYQLSVLFFIGVLDSSTDLRWLYNERFSFSLTRVYQQHGYKSFYLVSRRIHIV